MSEIQPPKQVEWLVMLYLSGDNNLSPDMVWAINEISESGVPNDVGVTIQYDALTPGAPTVRYRIDGQTKIELGAVPGPIPFPNAFAGQLEEDDAADPDVLAAFMRWSLQRYTAQYRMLILSGHGDGMLGDFLTDAQAKGSQPGSMSIKGLREAISKGARSDAIPATSSQQPQVLDPVLHVLGMDSCLMSTLEVAAELASERPRLVQYLVASEGLVPLSGWPYGYLLKMAKQRKEFDVKPVIRGLVEDCAAYYRSYLPAGISFDIAACDLAEVPHIVSAVKALTTALKPLSGSQELQDALVLAHWRAQSFKWEQYTDLGDFCEQLVSQLGQKHEDIVYSAGILRETIRDAVLARQHVGIDFQYAQGLSVYFPWSIPLFEEPDWLDVYGQLSFPNTSGWLEFLRTYVVATMRKPAELPEGKRGVDVGVVEWPPHLERKLGRSRELLAQGLAARGSAGVGDAGTADRRSARIQRSASIQRTSERVGSMKNLAQTVKVSVTPEAAEKIRSQPVSGRVGVERA
jgi:Clostripain family